MAWVPIPEELRLELPARYFWGHHLRWLIVPIAALAASLAVFRDTLQPPLLWGGLALTIVLLYGWLTLPAWFFAWFRISAWRVSRLVWRVRRWLRSGWGALGINVILASGFLWGRRRLLGEETAWSWGLQPDNALQIGVATLAMMTISWLVRTRRRLRVRKFSDLTGDQLKDWAPAAAQVFLGHLSTLINRFEHASQQASQASEGSNEGAQVTLRVDEVSDALKQAFSTDSKFKIGPVELPVGALVSLASRLLSGPTLEAGFHFDRGDLVVVASYARGARELSWTASAPVNGDIQRAAGAVTEELAYRVFTDLVSTGTNRWRAVRHLMNGLRAYREAKTSQIHSTPNLRKAEREFLAALAEDAGWAEQYYNLGIVYRDLGLGESARAAYEQALRSAPAHTDALLALSQERLDRKNVVAAVRLAKAAIRSAPANARTWHMLGYCLRRADKVDWSLILAFRRIATALAWRDLCSRRAAAADTGRRQQVAATATRNLAVAEIQRWDSGHRLSRLLHSMRLWYPGLRAMHHALCLSPHDGDLFFELGKIEKGLGLPRAAAAHLRLAVTLNPGEKVYWQEFATLDTSETPEPDVEATEACKKIDQLIVNSEWQEADKMILSAFGEDPHSSAIRARQARVLLELKKIAEALVAAEKAVATNPFDVYAQWALGEVRFRGRQDLDLGERSLEAAFHLNPANITILQSMATLASQRGVDSISKDARRENFRCVIEDLECAVESAGASSTGNLPGLGWLHHWLGRFHVELLHFDVGVSHLQIAAALGHEPVQSRIWRAYGLLDARAFARAAQAFREARLEFCKSRRGGTSITNPADRVMEIGLGYALCLIESRGNLRHAARLLRCCHRSAWTTLSPESRSEYRALWSAARGKLSLIEGKVEEAIHQLRQSLQILPTSLAYLWLAEATQRTGDAARRQQVTEYLDLAEHLDLRDLHQDRIQALRRSLQPNQ